jgi:hypothetical protein
MVSLVYLVCYWIPKLTAAQEDALRIVTSGDLLTVVNDVLDFSNQSGNVNIDIRRTNLQETLDAGSIQSIMPLGREISPSRRLMMRLCRVLLATVGPTATDSL